MTRTPQPRFRTVRYPEIGFPKEPRPELPPRVFSARLASVRNRLANQGLDALVVYGDREHYGNLAWLTNYDPRFEESLLVVLPKGTPVLFVGNEGMVYSNIARLGVRRQLYQTFSLLGQPRDKVEPLAGLLRAAGLGKCSRVGTAGWKYFSDAEFKGSSETLDLPDFIAHALRNATKTGGRVTNETGLFMDPETGLRSILEPDQIADFEWIATHNSQSLLQGIRALRPGMTEMEAFSRMACVGMPWCCHPVCTTGERLLKCVMPSPTSRRIQVGDPIFMTCAYQGSNTCRFGWVARGPNQLRPRVRDYVEKVAAPYFGAVAAWYEALKPGATGHDLHHAVWDRLTPLGFGLGLNIGHQIAADEWTHSLVGHRSRQQVRSGTYWQADFFPSVPGPHFGAFAEDGMVVADAALRRKLQRLYPALWRRMQARRRFMLDQLGIRISEDLLPMSNFPSAVIPFFLTPERCLAF